MKRSRHTVTLATGERKLVLAYGLEDARAFYEGSGKTVLQVVKGDLLNVPEDGGWKLSTANLKEAVTFLGLDWDGRVKQTSPVGNRLGAYSLRRNADGQPYHHITVKKYLTAARAGEVLWHELAHAMQAERSAAAVASSSVDAIMRAWASDDSRDGAYRNRPVEVEARSYEAFNAELPLARPL